MTDHDTNLLSLVAAAAAGALFMYWVDAQKAGRSDRAMRGQGHAQDGDELHATPPANAAWSEQGV
jgi:hypothetical protein